MGLQARLMSQALRKLTATISKTNTTCIFINQLRKRSGLCLAIPKQPLVKRFKILRFVRLDIRRSTQIKDVMSNRQRGKGKSR